MPDNAFLRDSPILLLSAAFLPPIEQEEQKSSRNGRADHQTDTRPTTEPVSLEKMLRHGGNPHSCMAFPLTGRERLVIAQDGLRGMDHSRGRSGIWATGRVGMRTMFLTRP
ncbi:hypothetical protein EMB92_06350 [Bifidobacterium callitrichos]|uniref:Uncharacterized protein n=1 Tax=Bifidobacterium callitrichos TaxID=762209 RepID=A0A5M9ZCR1_9BIFI|nr:hypothetical protein EMB92_06350 [Bifidobacterium callitrichos]